MGVKRIDTDIRQLYRDNNGFDEIWHLFPAVGMAGYLNHNAHDVHHISGGILGTPRYDLVSNLICLSRSSHLFAETFVFDGLALCMAAKIAKGEWDCDEMCRIMHLDSILGWLSIQDFEFEWTYQALLKSIHSAGERRHDYRLAASAPEPESEPQVSLHEEGQAHQEGASRREAGGHPLHVHSA